MDYYNFLSNRETALLIWFFVGLLIIAFYKSLRKPFGKVVVAFFKKRVLILFLLLFLYVFIIVYVLYILRYWDSSVLKDTLLWTFGLAIISLFRFNDMKYFSDLKIMLRDAVRWTIVIEFIANFYTFSLIAELIVQPFILLMVLSQSFS